MLTYTEATDFNETRTDFDVLPFNLSSTVGSVWRYSTAFPATNPEFEMAGSSTTTNVTAGSSGTIEPAATSATSQSLNSSDSNSNGSGKLGTRDSTSTIPSTPNTMDDSTISSTLQSIPSPPSTSQVSSLRGQPPHSSHRNDYITSSLAPTTVSSGTPTGVSSKISSSTLAGVAISCAIAGAVISTVSNWFFMRRRHRVPSSFSRRPSMGTETSGNGMEDPDTMMMALTKVNTQSTIEDLLPTPVQSMDLADTMRNLGTAVKNHGHSYYGGGDALMTGQTSALLSSLLGPSSPIDAKALTSLLSNPLYKVKAVRFLLAWSILQNPDHTSSRGPTLLPPELAGRMDAMNLQSNEAAARSTLLSKWRQMSATLMQPTYGGDAIPPQDRIQPNIHELVEALDAVLAPLASKRVDGERRQDLYNLVEGSARLIYVIFTLPTNWELDWQSINGQRKGELVVFPALLQVSDDQGPVRSDAQPLTEAQIVSVGKTNLQSS